MANQEIQMEELLNKVQVLYPKEFAHSLSECRADVLERELNEAHQVINALMEGQEDQKEKPDA